VGSLYFVQSMYDAGGAPSSTQLSDVWNAAIKPSLNASGWGFVHPDFARLFAPWALPLWLRTVTPDQREKIDRGWALEQAWRVALYPPNSGRYIKSQLSEWRDKVNHGSLPGIVFNATLTDTGAPLLLSTVALSEPARSKALIFGQDLSKDYGADISMVTAARLSATFPYVSPVARGLFSPSRGKCCKPADGYHVADGGYYDNFGLMVAVQWINDIVPKYRIAYGQNQNASSSQKNQIGKIILIQIDAFPDSDDTIALSNPPGGGGWTSEILGPVVTVLNSRSTAQIGRGLAEVNLLNNLNREYRDSSDSNDACPKLISSFSFNALHSGPLSWQLSPREIDQINCDWVDQRTWKEVQRLQKCLGVEPTPPASTIKCAAAAHQGTTAQNCCKSAQGDPTLSVWAAAIRLSGMFFRKAPLRMSRIEQVSRSASGAASARIISGLLK